jgi:sporulation protein YlmC with PRC-barrel domain
MTGLRSLIGRPVVGADSAEALGDVEGVLVDTDARRVTHLYVRHGRSDTIVSWDEIKAIGPDAVVLTTDVSPHAPENEREQAIAAGKLGILNKGVLDDVGFSHGELADLDFEPDSGAVESLLVEGQTLAADALIGIGSYAVVIRAPESAAE